jgi:hypothetical protein
MIVIDKKENVVVKNKGTIFLFVLFIIISFSLQSCLMEKECGENIIQQKTSSDKKYIAVLMERNCGVTTSLVNHINIRLADKDFEKSKSTNEILQGQVFRIPGGFTPQFEWLAGNKLKITCLNCLKAEYIGKLEKWEDVEILYEFSNN